MSHKKFIEALGRTGEIARLIGVTSQEISKWKKRNIPWPHRTKFISIAAAKNVSLPDGFLGEWEAKSENVS